MNTDSFALRHIGPRKEELQKMLNVVGAKTMEEIFFASLSKQILLILTLSERSTFVDIFQQLGLDIFIYPIIVIFVRIVFQVKKSEKSISYSIRNRT